MKTLKIARLGRLCLAGIVMGCTLGLAAPAHAAPKKVLVVTVTLGFRHSSIPTAEKVLAKLAEDTGAFTVDYARVEPNDPQFKDDNGKTDTAKVNAAIKAVLAEKMSGQALKQYDAVVFANTTGDLLQSKDSLDFMEEPPMPGCSILALLQSKLLSVVLSKFCCC